MLSRAVKQIFWAVIALASAITPLALDSRFYAVEAEVQVQRSPAALSFSWPAREEARSYTVRRKSANDGSWSGPIAQLPGNSTGFTDSAVSVGSAYEYEITMESTLEAPEGGFINAYSYLYAGIDIPERHTRGKAILVVDSSVRGALSAELETFTQDLRGDGWAVVEREVSRTGSVDEVKNLVRNEYNADPANARALILIGHVPVPYSGNIAPDMHASHRGAWPSDVYYGEMDGNWTDNTVSVRGEDFAENDNYPGDGKFDQSVIPSPAKLEVGRIDLWGMDEFQGRSEIDLLKNYFRKDHAFRHRLFTAPRQGLVRDNFGDLDGDAPAVDAWRHYTGFFGANRTREVGPGEFFGALSNDGYLWAYGCGGGGNDKADGVGSTMDFATRDPRAVFVMLHGSYFGDWNYPDNFLRAGIATPSFTLASVWTGLPHWYMHHMALGETIGYSTRISQNNLSLYKSYRNFSPAEVHVSLIGDPTLQMFPVIPASGLTGTVNGDVQLRWNASGDSDILGYHVYYATAANGTYNRLTTQPVTGTTFSHSVGVGVHYYMVRAVKLERTGSGSYRNLSQGVFTSVAKSSGGIGTTPGVLVETLDGDANEFRSKSGIFKFSRDTIDGTALTVFFALAGTAENGVDYNPPPSSVTIEPWAGSATLSIYPRADTLVEGDETVVLQLQQGSGYRVSVPASATITIHDHPPVVENQPPTIAILPDQVIAAGFTREIAFTVADAETAAGNLSVRAGSSDDLAVPSGKIVLGGSGANRTIQITGGTSGSATVTVAVSDGALESTRSFNVSVVANQPPIADAKQLNTEEDTPSPVVLTGTDIEGATLQYRIVREPLFGRLSGTPPLLVYTPLTNVNGVDTFTYVANDGTQDSEPATVAVTVTPINDPPIAKNDAVEASETGATFSAAALLANDIDPDGDELVVAAVQSRSTAGGSVALRNGTITYASPAGFTGTDIFSYTIRDAQGVTATASVQVQVGTRPSLTSVRPTSGGVLLKFSGPAGESVRIETSADTQKWTTAGSATIGTDGTGEFLDQQIGGLRMKIYRLEVE